MKTETLIERICSEKKVSKKTYYSQIDQLVGKKFKYYGNEVECKEVFEYIDYDSFFNGFSIPDEVVDKYNNIAEKLGSSSRQSYGDKNFPGYKAIFLLKLINKEDFSKYDGDEHIYANTIDISQSEEFRKEKTFVNNIWKKVSQKELDNVSCVCIDCGNIFGTHLPECATYHDDTCGVCGRNMSCTEPRDFGYLTKK